MFKNYTVTSFDTEEFWENLGRAVLPYGGNKGTLSNIVADLASRPNPCRSVVFEHDYVDEVYQDEYSAFYSKVFREYPDRCTRLHFFACNVSRGTRTNFGQYRRNYLGFLILRPTDLQRVGRTLLSPPLHNPDTEFVNCLAPFHAHIMGQKLSVMAMPFIQQDTQVGSCAQASLWMLSRYMSKRFGFRRFMPSEINEFAKAKIGGGRHLPAEQGLTCLQMLEALESMGFSAIYYQKRAMRDYSEHVNTAFPVRLDPNGRPEKESLLRNWTAKLADVAYRYIESGLPVIFGTDNHALVGIGHKYEFKANATVAIERIPAFYVNNDNRGCYREMAIMSPGTEYPFSTVDSVIAVMPREATLRGESAEDMARECVTEWLDLEVKVSNKHTMTLKRSLELTMPNFAPWLKQLEYRTFLIESVRFLQDIRQNMKKRLLDRSVGNQLLRVDYPKYIWVSEVSSSALLNTPKCGDRRCLGRIIVDSTAPANTRGAIAMHFADRLLLYDRHHGRTVPHISYHPDSTPFHHRIWSHHAIE